jgi:hypothetical protein
MTKRAECVKTDMESTVFVARKHSIDVGEVQMIAEACYTPLQANRHTHTHTQAHTCVQTHTNTHIQTQTHTDTHMHTHTHTPGWGSSLHSRPACMEPPPMLQQMLARRCSPCPASCVMMGACMLVCGNVFVHVCVCVCMRACVCSEGERRCSTLKA